MHSRHKMDTLRNLKLIKNIRFTNREIDIIACILSGKSYKKIATLLDISSKTVEIHVRNLILKLGCNSREGIIEFIEKSDKFNLIKQHYSDILIRIVFEQELKKIAKIPLVNSVHCIIFYYDKQKTKSSAIYKLERYLAISGIKTLSKVWEKGKSKNFILNQVGNIEINHIIYLVSDEFAALLSRLDSGYKIEEEVTGLASIIKKDPNAIIFALLNGKEPFSVATHKEDVIGGYTDQSETNRKELAGFESISLKEQKNYYFLIFELLKKILPQNNIEANINEFKKSYDVLSGSLLIDNSADSDNPDCASSGINIQNSQRKIKLVFFVWPLLFFLFFALGFTIFNISKDVDFLNIIKKPIALEKVTDNTPPKVPTVNITKSLAFNIPPYNNQFTGRKEALALLKKQLNKKKIGIITQTISGLGGVGKTQLAARFAHQAIEENNYSIVLWINAETANAINSTYKELAEFLHIDIRGLNIQQIQKVVHQHIIDTHQGGGVLFILDNVPNYSFIKNYLLLLHKQLAINGTLHLLITSRNQGWPEEPLALDTFTPEEAKEFVEKYLPNEGEDALVNLIQALFYFPLALDQAVAYIKAHTNIEDYLKLYVAKQKEYLDKFSNDKNQYNESLWKTWNIALTKLTAHAKEMLSISSYLYPDNIPFAFFDNLTIEERANAIEDLRKYSFVTINNDNKSFKIHRLLQEVIRITTATEEKNNIFKEKFAKLTKATSLLKNKFNFSYARYDSWGLCDQYLTHAQSLAEHEINAGSNEFTLSGVQLYAQIAMYLTYVQQNFENAKEVFEKILILVKHHYILDKSFVSVLANIYTHLGYIEKLKDSINQAEKYFAEAISVYETKIPSISKSMDKLLDNLRWDQNLASSDGIQYDHSFALHQSARLKQELAQYDTARNLYEKAVKLLDKSNSDLVYKSSLLLVFSGLYLYRLGIIEEGQHMLNLGATIINKNFPNHLALVVNKNHYIGLYQYYTGIYTEARETIENNLKTALLIYSKNHPTIGKNLAALGLILCVTNRINEGINDLKLAETIYNNFYKKENLYFAPLYLKMHYAYETHKEYDKALQYLMKVQEVYINHWQGKKLFLQPENSPIENLPSLKVSEKNVYYYTQALSITKTLFGVDNIRTGRYHYLLGQVFENIQAKDKARLHYKEALRIFSKQHFDSKMLALKHQQNIRIIDDRLKECTK